MLLKVLNSLVAVLAGVGAALVLYWVLNKLAEMMPSKWEERLKPYIFILPAYAAMAFYLIYPSIQTLFYAFKDPTSTSWVGFENFTNLLGSSDFRQTLLNTLLWIIIVPAVTVTIGLGVAVLSDRLRPSAEKAAKTLIFLPMAISMVGAATVWRFVYAFRPPGQNQIGLQNAVIGVAGHDPVPWMQQTSLHFNSILLMVMLLWAQVGLGMVLLSAAIKGVPDDTLEAARIDGANERQIFFRVVIPQIMGTIVLVFVTSTITVLKTFDIVYAMTNGNFNTNILAVEFYNQLFTNFNNGAAAAIVVLLMLATAPVMAFQVRQFRRENA